MQSIVLVGAGGYGALYAAKLLKTPDMFAGVVDPYWRASPYAEELIRAGVARYDTLEEFYRQNRATLAVVATPIALHAEHVLTAFAHDSHVLVEKPLAATVEAGERMIAGRDAAGKVLAVGFQWCYDPAMLALKRDVEAGVWGRPRALRAMVLWPRDRAYYRRGSGWAGKKRDAAGRMVMDSVASNATAHYLENMLWLIGKGFGGARIESLSAWTARANDIETYDSAVLRAHIRGGAEVFFVASHAAGRGNVQEPMFQYEFENGTITFGALRQSGLRLIGTKKDGSTVDYGNTYPGGEGLRKLEATIAAIEGRETLPCPAEAALAHTVAMEMTEQSMPAPYVFSHTETEGELVWVPGLYETLLDCYARRRLPGRGDFE